MQGKLEDKDKEFSKWLDARDFIDEASPTVEIVFSGPKNQVAEKRRLNTSEANEELNVGV